MRADSEFMMNFNSKRYLAVFLLYVVATAGCKPADNPAQRASQSAFPLGRNRLTWGFYDPSNRGGPRRLLPPGRTSRSLGDTEEDVPGQIRGAAVTGENRENLRRMSAVPRPPRDDCTAGKVEAVTPGRVFISGQLEVISPNAGYQADSAFPGETDLVPKRRLISPNLLNYIFNVDEVKFPACSVEYFLLKKSKQIFKS